MPLTRPEWPGGARCAVALTFDNFGESYDLLRYGHAGGASADGVYAPRRGVPRVLDLLERYQVPATFFLEGWNVRKYAPLAREIAARGHEVAAHGWMHERWSELAPDRERELIRRTTATLADVLGWPPRGWRAPAGLTTTATLALLHEAGYRYDSSCGDEDVPYWLGVGAGRDGEILELPWSWALDDAAYYAYPGVIRRPGEVAELWIEEFDAALAQTGYFILVCHPRYSGRPARVAALERLLDHIAAQDDVWFARCEDLAAHVGRQPTTPHYPAPATMPREGGGGA
ncbi:MAG TPA: polysaccharide deacetylase family protein [Thermomicrobiales bacterium]|nr:polysaccharide deacetylase family protein [Thermomicrobiales bacterium]